MMVAHFCINTEQGIQMAVEVLILREIEGSRLVCIWERQM